MKTLLDLPAGPEVPRRFFVVVETPRGSRVRYAFDPELGAIRQGLILGDDSPYPADYGFIPSTLAMDGKPLDVLVLTDEPSFPGCVLECRSIAVLNVMEGDHADHKILAVLVDDESARDIQDFSDLPGGKAEEISRFFAEHPHLAGTDEEVVGWDDAEVAKDLVFRAWEGFLI